VLEDQSKSEKVLRIARLYDRALEVFEDQQAAEKWLKEPARGLGEAIPLNYARTELIAQEVERLLTRFGLTAGWSHLLISLIYQMTGTFCRHLIQPRPSAPSGL